MEFREFPKMARLSRSILPLTNGGYALCSEDDFDALSKHKWFHVMDGNQIYAARSGSSGKLIRMHSEVVGYLGADHKNGDGLDNRRCNLRAATVQQNQMNRGKFTAAYSTFKGVTWHKRDRRWISRIKVNGIRIQLGSFVNEIDAAKAYNNAAKNHFGEFARVNQL